MSCRAILIAGLRRSGTTALWECFRGLPGLAAFDEPFHPALAAGARDNPKGTWRELAEVLAAGPDGAQDGARLQPQAIGPLAELEPRSRPAETAYLGGLLATAPRVVIDEVRVWNRLPALCPDPAAVLTVHLVRDPAGWVTGHLLPTGRGTWRKPLADLYRRARFFTRRGFYDNYHYETIIDAALAQHHPVWKTVALPVERLRRAPAFVKLLAFWWAANLATHRALAAAGVPRRLVTPREFVGDPRRVLDGILGQAGWDGPAPGTGHVRPTRPEMAAGDPRWTAAAQALGIPAALLAPGGADAARLAAAFDAAAFDTAAAARPDRGGRAA
jgi:hypothetical protein